MSKKTGVLKKLLKNSTINDNINVVLNDLVTRQVFHIFRAVLAIKTYASKDKHVAQ